MNYDKTIIYRIGSLRHSKAMLYNMDQVAWSNEDINVLGVTVAHENIVQKNYESLINKTRSILNSWKNRGLTLMGKVLVVNTMVMSLFVYKMMVLPSIPETIVKQIENEIRRYLWNNGKAKISLQILQNPKEQGGLNLADLRIKDKALKATWPQILYREEEYSTMVYGMMNISISNDIWRANLKPQDVEAVGIKHAFWKDVLKSWCEFNYWRNFTLENQMIWYNSRIRVENKPFVLKGPLKRGLKYVYQLFEKGKICTYETLRANYSLSVMEYNMLIASIPVEWKEFFCKLTLTDFMPVYPSNYDLYKDSKSLSRLVYKALSGDVLLLHNKAMKWNQVTGTTWGAIEFAQCLWNIRKYSNYTKMRDFQYRFLQRAIVTNKMLKKWGIVESDICFQCKKQVETLEHIFIECTVAKMLWEDYRLYAEKELGKQVEVKPSNIVTNDFCKPRTHVANTIGLYIKQYLYKQRCLKEAVSFAHVKASIAKLKSMEKYIAVRDNKIMLYRKKWEYRTRTEENIYNYTEQYIAEI